MRASQHLPLQLLVPSQLTVGLRSIPSTLNSLLTSFASSSATSPSLHTASLAAGSGQQSAPISAADERSSSAACSCSYSTTAWQHSSLRAHRGQPWLQLRGFAADAKTAAQKRGEIVTQALKKDPQPLSFDRGSITIPEDLDNAFGKMLMKMMGFYSKKSQLIHGGQRLYDAVKEQVDTGALQKSFGTGKVFWSTYALLSVHVWMIINRLGRSQNQDVKFFRQRFYMQFQQDVEHRVYAAGVQVGVTRWLKKLEEHFYDAGPALDKVLKGEGKLEAVLLAKFYGGEPKHAKDAALLAAYVTRELQCLLMTQEKDILVGHIKFSTDLQTVADSLPVESTAAAAAAAGSAEGSAPAGGAMPAGAASAPDGAGVSGGSAPAGASQ